MPNFVFFKISLNEVNLIKVHDMKKLSLCQENLYFSRVNFWSNFTVKEIDANFIG